MVKFQWPWKKHGLSDEDREATLSAQRDVRETSEQVERLHRETVQTIYHNHLGEVFTKALAVPHKEGR